ncbi:MAG: hypothetical protein Q9218_003024 [Villophora microphyllina]
MSDEESTKLNLCIAFILEQLKLHNQRCNNNAFFLGINGVQGIGKTYLVSSIARTLENSPYEIPTVVLSIDDFYLSHEDQRRLAASHPDNPLVQHRGQPSTHDLDLAISTLSSLRANCETIIPSYDKSAFNGQGDRVQHSQWSKVNVEQEQPIRLMIVEGWCLAFRSLDDNRLKSKWEMAVQARNQGEGYLGRLGHSPLEDIEFLNEALKGYDAVTDQLDALIHLDAEDSQYVYDWRQEQEAALRRDRGSGMTDEQMLTSHFTSKSLSFLGHFLFSPGLSRAVIYRRELWSSVRPFPKMLAHIAVLSLQHAIDSIATTLNDVSVQMRNALARSRTVLNCNVEARSSEDSFNHPTYFLDGQEKIGNFRMVEREASHPAVLPRDDRQNLFRLCIESVSDPERYLSMWFKGAPSHEIGRENVKQFFCWSFLNKSTYGLLDDSELEDYADQLERTLGRKLPQGRGNATSMNLTLDPVHMLPRPLIWYLFHRVSLKRSLTVFPPRPLTLLTSHTTPARTLSYWHRRHTSNNRVPVLFIHGIGIGLWTYAPFLAQLTSSEDDQADGDVGVIAIEIMPVSFRITHAALTKEEMKDEILQIVRSQGWTKFCLAAHSYGSVVATHLLQDSVSSSMIEATLLVDPVSILLHLPEVAYNFTCRQPVEANEHQLYYFASMDMGVAHTLSRRFFWQENIIWKHELEGRKVTVVLCGRDLITNTQAVGQYLAGDEASSWKYREWEGSGLELIWFDKFDHSQVFENKRDYGRLVKVLQQYTLVSRSSSESELDGR